MNIFSKISLAFTAVKLELADLKKDEVKEMTKALLNGTVDMYNDKNIMNAFSGVIEGFVEWSSQPENAEKVRTALINIIGSGLRPMASIVGPDHLQTISDTFEPIMDEASRFASEAVEKLDPFMLMKKEDIDVLKDTGTFEDFKSKTISEFDEFCESVKVNGLPKIEEKKE